MSNPEIKRDPIVFGPRLSRLLRAYYLGPDHPMKIRIWGILRRLLGDPRLTLPYADGGWITLNEQDYLQREILIRGTYEPEVWDVLADCATTAEVVWDVGANIGSFAIRAARDPRVAKVHAFEPDPLNSQVLHINNRLNGGRFLTHSIALSDQLDRRLICHGPATNTGMSTLKSDHIAVTRSFWVDCTTVDHLVFTECLRPPTLIKVDVEGWESFVLKGAARLLAEVPPKAIVFEAECDSALCIAEGELLALLTDVGYTVEHIPRRGDTPKPRENYLARRQ